MINITVMLHYSVCAYVCIQIQATGRNVNKMKGSVLITNFLIIWIPSPAYFQTRSLRNAPISVRWLFVRCIDGNIEVTIAHCFRRAFFFQRIAFNLCWTFRLISVFADIFAIQFSNQFWIGLWIRMRNGLIKTTN